MGQIVKRKKKGRPSKADLAARALSASERDTRRSLRRRNVRYNVIDCDDDYIEEDDEEDEEEEEVRRREKKVKLVDKLHSSESARSSIARGGHAQGNGASAEENEEEDGEEERGKKPLKKRKINGVDDRDNIDDKNDNRHDQGDDDDDEIRVRKGDTTGQDSAPGTPTESASGLPLPDKKVLALILDKLQKKDIYGVYAEPVDLEELPDYLDYIDNPMDFSTVRKKLAIGSYCTLEQFESDVFLICSNAMQYNAPETIYHKQARSIEELAMRKFQRLRANIERAEVEMKAEQRTQSNSLVKKQIKKPFGRTIQEPVGSDFSSGVTLANHGDVQNCSAANQASGCQRPFVTDEPLEANYSLVDNNIDKMEDMPSGKGLPSKLGRKPYVVDENHRATYIVSNQTVSKSDSIFTTFENEVKQLVSVGLHAEHGYARSLAHFAATLGPVAWKIASQRIELALPAGFKFGRGWVGEYEPLPTSVLMLEPQTQKEFHFFKLKGTTDARKVDMTSNTPIPPNECALSGPGKELSVSGKDEKFLGRSPREPFAYVKEHRVSGSVREHFSHAKDHPVSGLNSEAKPSLFHPRNGAMLGTKQSLFASAGMAASHPAPLTYLQQNLLFSNTAALDNKVTKQVELNLPPSANQHDADFVADKQRLNNSEMPVSRSREMVPRNLNLPKPLPFKQPDYNGVGSRGLPNGKVTGNPLDGGMISSSTDTVPNQVSKAAATFLAYGQEKSIRDPVELTTRLAENGQKHQRSTNHTPCDSPSVAASVPSVRNYSSNASSIAAHAWMSIGAGAFKQPTENSSTHKTQISAELLYNQARQLHPQSPRVQGQSLFPASAQLSDKNSFQYQVFPHQPFPPGNDSQSQDRSMAFPQLVTTDFSRFHGQSPWRDLSPHSQPRPKHDTLPPDLNIGFQPPGSPVKLPSNSIMDSQLPDLALQL